ncbi:hydroxyisourate hydrolase [Roseomonas sp. CCTCC AB2023176]|uniref:hydroxyisourate hydrolase n=1 Tax=Roseomonas sp. CCTCC AB2023176 TaxID=3342640 RepID=UPI0035E23827
MTNADGRADTPLLPEGATRAGTYELTYDVAAYFRGQGVDLPDPPFLDRVTLRFGVAEDGRHYHVPLLVSPFGYTTYRGS